MKFYNEIKSLYIEQNLTYSEVADILKVSRKTINYYATKYGFSKRVLHKISKQELLKLRKPQKYKNTHKVEISSPDSRKFLSFIYNVGYSKFRYKDKFQKYKNSLL